MSKKISPSELAEIVCGLLMKPELLGELDTPKQHQAFMLDIGRVVANHCGGDAFDIDDPKSQEGFYMANENNVPLLSVSPPKRFPYLQKSVWSNYDCYAEEGDNVNPIVSASDKRSIENDRAALMALMSNNALQDGMNQSFEYPMIDWRVSEQVDIPVSKDKTPYTARIELGNQSYVEVQNDQKETVFGLMFEINKGVPSLCLRTLEDDNLLLINAVDGELILTPDDSRGKFEPVPTSQYTYDCSNAIKIRQA